MKFLVLLAVSTFFALGMFQNPQCAVTGGTDSGDTCKDLADDCKVSLCNSTAYKPLMCGLCQQTCCMCKKDNFDPCKGVTTVTPPPTTPGPNACNDVDPNCQGDITECNQPMFRPLMCKYCRVSQFSFILKYRSFSANL